MQNKQGNIGIKKIDDEKYGLYLNDKVILELETSNIDEAFSYYDLPYHENDNNEIDIILLKYNGNNCVIDNIIVRCKKLFVIDLVKDIFISNQFYPPVLNDKLLYIKWGSEKSRFIFENGSVFIYKKGSVEMIDSGYVAE
ncbi:hypothetical protein JK232_11675 [Nissabacter archeti]|uniref:Uncharacterized protein n=1 Tax=Nissabacter archeti TaxID=1917880 RepID=A0ABS5JHZ2_9GAMM|nr:hypothetical protein [Nissabacter archeti]MBS0969550.1 hypothetical protein [Nissabacter archeti]